MPKLSVCIPVEPGFSPPHYIVEKLLANAESDIEVIVAPYGDGWPASDPLFARAAADPRLKILPPITGAISASNFWLATIAASKGDWISLIYPDDMIEPDLPRLLAYLEKKHPNGDALGWNAFQIAENAPRDIKTAVPVPVVHDSSELDKARMLDAFFQWTGSQQTPKVPFGIFHGAIKRSLLDQILAGTGSLSWQTPVPRYEWSARVVIFASCLVLCNRPLSAVSTQPFQPVKAPSILEGFPFDASLGVTAAIAEIQARVLQELGAAWQGFNENFINACMFDCMLEHNEAAFEQKSQAYFTAIHRMPGGGALADKFRPSYFKQFPDDPRRGLHGQMLLIDRFIGNARTAQEFFDVARGMIAPIFVITDLVPVER
ncbi:MAG: hypothetical protein ACOH2J_14310 [Allorhizobium sp.]